MPTLIPMFRARHPTPQRKQVLIASLLALMSMAAARGVNAEESAKQAIEGTVQDAFKVLRDQNLKHDTQQRLRKLREIADRRFDWEAMAKSSLGPKWRDLGPGQRKEFVDVFKELLAQRYMDDIDRFQGGEQVQIGASEQQAEQAVVKTTLITSSREQVPIDYSMHLASGGWRVDDVTIEGISLVNHYRKTFGRYLMNKKFSELLQQLKRQLGPSKAGSAEGAGPP